MHTDIQAVTINDTTLRDGEQAPGVVFSLEEKIHIARYIEEIGIQELEIGNNTISEQDKLDICTIINEGFTFRTSC